MPCATKKSFRSDIESIKSVLIPVGMNGSADTQASGGMGSGEAGGRSGYVPLGEVAEVYMKPGPDMLKKRKRTACLIHICGHGYGRGRGQVC
ncbi:MAG: hypothetical protein LRY51_07560 [Geovibrio sp.]|nr:hypothetical protein [Geovibrio sp.]